MLTTANLAAAFSGEDKELLERARKVLKEKWLEIKEKEQLQNNKVETDQPKESNK